MERQKERREKEDEFKNRDGSGGRGTDRKKGAEKEGGKYEITKN